MIVAEVAFVVVHVRVADWLGAIAVGRATSVHASGGGIVTTVTVAVHVTDPPSPVAAIV